MQYFDAEQVHRACPFDRLMTAFETYHREETEVIDDLLLHQPGDGDIENNFFLRSAWQYDRAMGVKLVTLFPDNPSKSSNLPAIQAIYVLFDGKDGKPIAAIDGTALTYRKTAADSALGSRYLARPDCKTMLMVGAGAMAPYLIAAHRVARPGIQHVMIWNRSTQRAHSLVEKQSQDDASFEVVDDLASAVPKADLICSATMTRSAIIQGKWLRPGTHLDLVGAFKPDMREADDEVLRRGDLFVDSRATTIAHIGELMIPLERGVIKCSDVLADLYDLARGRHPGRERPEQITVFKNGGGGHLDLMTARQVVAAS